MPQQMNWKKEVETEHPNFITHHTQSKHIKKKKKEVKQHYNTYNIQYHSGNENKPSKINMF